MPKMASIYNRTALV